jgi:uncharacterized metal-binding protein YceD (DUF177 family)
LPEESSVAIKEAAPVEFSRPAALDRAALVAHVREIAATADERAALAGRLGLLSLDKLAARLSWRRQPGGIIRLEGELEAAVSQSCVVTLEPVAAALKERFVRYFARDLAAAQDEVVIDPAADDPPEPLGDGMVDLGEIVVEQLAIALDPYPRSAGAGLPDGLGGSAAAARPAEAEHPFDVLATLRTERR